MYTNFIYFSIVIYLTWLSVETESKQVNGTSNDAAEQDIAIADNLEDPENHARGN